MKPTKLRTFAHQYGGVGYLLVGIYLLTRHLWQNHKWSICLTSGIIVVICLCETAHPLSGSAAQKYVITAIETLPNATECAPRGINDSGLIVGTCTFANGLQHAFLWQQGKIQDLGKGDTISRAYAINASGVIVGESKDIACLWRNGKLQSLGILPGYSASSAIAVSDTNDVAGYCFQKPNWGMPFRWQQGEMMPIEPLDQDEYAKAAAINRKAVVVGRSENERGDTLAFINASRSSRSERIPTLGGPQNAATAINDRGQVVGSSNYQYRNESAFHAFLWEGDKPQDLGGIDGMVSEALAINNKTQIVGWSQTLRSEYRAILWQKGTMHDLNTLIPEKSGWVLEKAIGINDKGQIVGTGRLHGEWRAFLLTPKS